MKPLIGLSGRRVNGRTLGYPEVLHDLEMDLYFADYSRAVIAAGGIPLLLPLDLDPLSVIDRLDGVLLSGGADVEPSRYDAERDPNVVVVEPERDAFEFPLVEATFERDMPLLGICRGMQLLNVARGGTLTQHVPEHLRYDIPVDSTAHHVHIEADSTLASVYGSDISPQERNSLHHQIVDQVGDGLRVVARADDGTVEALELNDHVIAVQWHPEMMATRDSDPIFTWLVDNAKRYAARRA